MLAKASHVIPWTPPSVHGFPGGRAYLFTSDQYPALQRLLTGLASRCATCESEAIDDTLTDGLQQIAETLRLDFAILWGTAADGGPIATHRWMRNQEQTLPDPSQFTTMPFVASKLEAAAPVWLARLEDLPDEDGRDALARIGMRAVAFLPIAADGTSSGVTAGLALGSTTSERDWTPAEMDHLRMGCAVVAQALTRKANGRALRRAAEELRELRERKPHVQDAPGVWAKRTSRLPEDAREDAHERSACGPIVGKSAAIRHVLEQVQQVAATDSTVLLLGETGTGKELFAARIHELSARRGRSMVRVNCAAIPNTLIESELFGREKGAFTGALARQAGRFELADRSTIFLDEIGDLPADIQVKLLRVLEERQIERLGSPRAIHVDVRIIAATHRNLEKRIADDEFREDLFYRLNVFPIRVPPLRERQEDIPLLVWRFVDEFSKSFGRRVDVIPKENMTALQRYAWPGNIRELRNVVERAMIVTTGPELTIALPPPTGQAGKLSIKMSDVEKEHLRSVLEGSGWRIRGIGGAADKLGLRPTTLETRMAKLGLVRPKL
jgi:transcriptional regulator with GAF, ATPase, and Fis domain